MITTQGPSGKSYDHSDDFSGDVVWEVDAVEGMGTDLVSMPFEDVEHLVLTCYRSRGTIHRADAVTPHNRSTARSRIHELGGCKGGPDCDLLIDLLNQVEDDRAHAEAVKIRDLVTSDPVYRPKWKRGMLEAADLIDPYMTRDDGQLVRKSDGKPVTGE